MIAGRTREAIVGRRNSVGKTLQRRDVVKWIDTIVKIDAVAGIDAQQSVAVIVRRNDLCRTAGKHGIVRNDLAFARRFVDLGIAIVVQAVCLERIDELEVGRIGDTRYGDVVGGRTSDATRVRFIGNVDTPDVSVEGIAVVGEWHKIAARRADTVNCLVTDFLGQNQPRFSDRQSDPASKLRRVPDRGCACDRVRRVLS